MITSEFQTLPLILVVDDEKMTRLVMRRVMEKDGYDIVEACNSWQCLKICQEKQTDIVLLDAVMPGIDSFTCCEQLQRILGKDCPPILIITSLNDRAWVDIAFEAGATDYVTKPFTRRYCVGEYVACYKLGGDERTATAGGTGANAGREARSN